jgi:hypothetical protein
MFIRQKMLRRVPVALKSPSQTFGVVTRKGGVLSPPAERFVELLRQQMQVEENLPEKARQSKRAPRSASTLAPKPGRKFAHAAAKRKLA